MMDSQKITNSSFSKENNQASSIRPRSTGLSGATCRLLVVEDNDVSQEMTIRMLKKLGCNADGANNGKLATTMHFAQPYDLILMDCQMPEMDGYEATACIRAEESGGGRTPIIALTAALTEIEREKCHTSGMDDIFLKPVRQQMLQNMLSQWLPVGTSTAPTSPPVLIEDELENVQTMFGKDFSELATLYLTMSPKRIADLRQAAAVGELVQLARLAHAFSGSCTSIGALILSAACKELETLAKAGNATVALNKVAIVEIEYARTSATLQTMLCR